MSQDSCRFALWCPRRRTKPRGARVCGHNTGGEAKAGPDYPQCPLQFLVSLLGQQYVRVGVGVEGVCHLVVEGTTESDARPID